MGIKLKNRDPKYTDFASNDIVINHKEGTLFFKSDTEVVKLENAKLVKVENVNQKKNEESIKYLLIRPE